MALSDLIKQIQLKSSMKRTGIAAPGKPEEDTEEPGLTEAAKAAQGLNQDGEAEEVAAPTAAGGGWKPKLGNALQAAGAAIQANVGQTYPGQSFANALSKGIVGMGAAEAAKQRLEAAKANKEASLSGQLALLQAQEEGRNERQQAGIDQAGKKAGDIANAQLPAKREIADINAQNALAKIDAVIADKRKNTTGDDELKKLEIAAGNAKNIWSNMPSYDKETSEADPSGSQQFSRILQEQIDAAHGKIKKAAKKEVAGDPPKNL